MLNLAFRLKISAHHKTGTGARISRKKITKKTGLARRRQWVRRHDWLAAQDTYGSTITRSWSWGGSGGRELLQNWCIRAADKLLNKFAYKTRC